MGRIYGKGSCLVKITSNRKNICHSLYKYDKISNIPMKGTAISERILAAGRDFIWKKEKKYQSFTRFQRK